MWNPESHQAKQKKSVDRLVSYFKNKGVDFSPTDGEFNNVVFTSKDKEVKMSHHSFYRYSGIACAYKDKGENKVEAVEITDEMFLNNYIKPTIEKLLGD